MEPAKRWVLFSGLSSFFLSIAMLYQMSPFFQTYAEETAGASHGSVGLIFATLPASAFVFAAPGGAFIARYGPRIALSSGLLVLAVSSILFGLCSSVEGWLLWRAVQGAASAPIYSSVNCMFAQTFTAPGEFAMVNSVQEAAASIGFAVGPMLGGALFQWGGFVAPFAVCAAGHLLFVGLSVITPDAKAAAVLKEPLIGPQGYCDGRPCSMGELCDCRFVLLAFAGVLVPAIFGALDPVLAAHFTACLGNISSSTIGTIMAACAVSQAPVAMLVPWLMRLASGPVVVLLGTAVMAASSAALALSDPDAQELPGAPGIAIATAAPAQWTLQISCMVFVGVASGLGWTPVLPEMMEGSAARLAERRAIEQDRAMEFVSPHVASLFNGAAALGEAAGPILGGLLLSRFGFSGAGLLMSAAFAFYGLALALHLLAARDPSHKVHSKRRPTAPKLRTATDVRNPKESDFAEIE